MNYRNLGRTGTKVSELCLGTMQFGWTADEANSFEVMDSFTAAGGATAMLPAQWQGLNARMLRHSSASLYRLRKLAQPRRHLMRGSAGKRNGRRGVSRNAGA